MIIDIRCRPSTPENMSYFGQMNRGGDYGEAAREASLDLFIKEMDEAGIDIAIGNGRNSAGLDLGLKKIPPARIPNDHLAELQLLYPKRIVGLAGIDAGNVIHNALDETRRSINELGLRGIFIETGRSPGLPVNDRQFYPLYELCVELNVPLMPQTSVPFGWANIDDGHPRYIDTIARDFPQLTIVCGHACYPYVREMIVVAIRHANVFVSPDMYFFASGTEDWIKAANGPIQDQFCFGTAYPAIKMAPYTAEFLKQPWHKEILEKILWRNAVRAFHLEDLVS